MNRTTKDDKRIRSYLLGELDAEDRRQVEERIMTDDSFSDRVDLAEEELVDDYVQGRLSGRKRERFESLYLSTEEGREHLRFAQSLKEYAAKRPEPAKEVREGQKSFWPPLFRRPAWQFVVAFAALAAGGLLIFYNYESDLDKGLSALNKAYSAQRPFEGRISEFGYAPPPSDTRGNQTGIVDTIKREAAERFILDAVNESSSAESLYALGKLYLAKRDFQNAIGAMEQAQRLAPDNAELYADLGVAYFEQGKTLASQGEITKDNEFFARSLTSLNRALELNPSLMAPLFNRALLYEAMMLPNLAKDDWESYLKKDQNSGWAGEAKERLMRLEAEQQKRSTAYDDLHKDFLNAFERKDYEGGWRALSQCYRDGLNLIVDQLIREHLASAITGDSTESNAGLAALQFAGESELKRCGDHFTADLADFYLRASLGQKQRISGANELIRLAREEASKSKYDSATDYFSRAEKILKQEGVRGQSIYVKHKVAHCYVVNQRIDEGIEIFEQLLEDCEKEEYWNLYARISETLATGHSYIKALSKELECNYRSLEIYEKTGNSKGKLEVYVHLAGIYQNYGDGLSSLVYSDRVLDSVGSCPVDKNELASLYRAVSGSFAEVQLYDAAIAYQKECVRINAETATPLRISRAYTFLGELYRRSGQIDEAISNIERALDVGKGVSDKSAQKHIPAYSLVFLGDAYSDKGDMGKALESYDQAIRLNEELRIPLWSYNAHKGKLLCYIARDDATAVRQEMEKTLELYDMNRSEILADGSKISFSEREQSIYDLMIDYEFTRNPDPQVAFNLSEMNRGRALLDLASTTPRYFIKKYKIDIRAFPSSVPMKLDEIQRRMPAGAQLLQYAVLNDKVLMWVVTRNKVIQRQSGVDYQELSLKVMAYMRKISSPSGCSPEEIERESKELYSLLIKPVEDSLDKEKTLCIVADKVLHHLPFQALVSPESNSYMVKDFLFIYAPSSNIFIRCYEAAQSRENPGDEKLLCLGDPTFDQAEFPNLPYLPAARQEAQKLASYYNSPTVEFGQRATRALLDKEVADCDVLHLATHCVVDRQTPLLSKLLLAKRPDPYQSQDSGALQAHDIYTWKLPRTRLVVLSACQTGVENSYKGEGAVGIARPFLSAGVPLVTASLWRVDSPATAEMMVDFHKYRRQPGRSTAEALRLAQIEMLEGEYQRLRHPYYWAAFVLIGGFTRY